MHLEITKVTWERRQEMDNQILEQLYLRYDREITLYLFSLCKNWDTAEDIKQETFMKAIFSLSEQHTNMRAWLYHVARNLCINNMTKEKHFVPLEEYEEILKKDEDILEQYITQEDYRNVYLAVLKLPPPKKEILELQYFGGLSLKEIAKLLHLTYEGVRVQKHRAKQELKKILKEGNYDIP